MSTLEGEEGDPEASQDQRRQLFRGAGGAGGEGKWGQLCMQLLALLDAASLQLSLMQVRRD